MSRVVGSSDRSEQGGKAHIEYVGAGAGSWDRLCGAKMGELVVTSLGGVGGEGLVKGAH